MWISKKELQKSIEGLYNRIYDDSRYYKSELTKLESKNTELSKEIDKLKWMVQNPCQYKVGDKLPNGEIIHEVYLHWPYESYYFQLLNNPQWMYKSIKPNKK